MNESLAYEILGTAAFLFILLIVLQIIRNIRVPKEQRPRSSFKAIYITITSQLFVFFTLFGWTSIKMFGMLSKGRYTDIEIFFMAFRASFFLVIVPAFLLYGAIKILKNRKHYTSTEKGKMDKIKSNRIIGRIMCLIGIVAASYDFFKRGGQQFFINAKDTTDLTAGLFGILSVVTMNLFLWIGVILLWKTARDEKPDQKSIWSVVIIIYAILSIAVGVIHAIHI